MPISPMLKMGAAVFAFGLLALPGAPVAADDNSNCPAGQPSGRSPGQPPSEPGRPSGRPAQYPPGECNLALSRGAVARGQSVRVSGGGFHPGDEVTLRLAGREVGRATAGPSGVFEADLVVPTDAPVGRTQVLASSASRELSATIEVLGAPASTAAAADGPSRLLPRTGTGMALTAASGLLLVAVGTAAIMGARRRRTSHA